MRVVFATVLACWATLVAQAIHAQEPPPASTVCAYSKQGANCGPSVYNFLLNKGKNDGKDTLVNVTIGLGSASLVVDTDAFAPDDCHTGASCRGATDKAIGIVGAGASGGTLSAKIVGYTSARQVLLSTTALTAVSNATKRVFFGTDNTDALNALVIRMVANNGGDIYLPAGLYMVNGPFLPFPTSAGASGKSIILIPERNAGIAPININIIGQFPAPYGGESVIGSQTVYSGGSILMTAQGDVSNPAAIIGGASGLNGYPFTAVNLGIINMVMRTYDDPNITAIDAHYIAGFYTSGTWVDTGTNPISMHLPNNTNAIGIATPLNNNGAYTQLMGTTVIGYYVDYQINEHTDGDYLAAWFSRIGYQFNVAFHSIHMKRIASYHSVWDTQFENFGTGTCNAITSTIDATHFDIEELNVEWTSSGAFAHQFNVVDTANSGCGSVKWHLVQATIGVTHELTMNGGAMLTLQEIGTPYHDQRPGNEPIAVPGGRLTLQTGNPVQFSDIVGAGTIYYDSYLSQFVPLYNGNTIRQLPVLSGEISLILDATHHVSGSVYDVFAVGSTSNGPLALCTGPAWSSTTTRGSGAGTTQIVKSLTGYFTNAVALAHCYNNNADALAATFIGTGSDVVLTASSVTGIIQLGSTVTGTGVPGGTTIVKQISGDTGHAGVYVTSAPTTSATASLGSLAAIPAGRATYLGSFYATANGQTTEQFQAAPANGGSNAVLGLFNAYNRVPMTSRSGDSTSSWTYDQTTWRTMNGSNANRITWLDGLRSSGVTATSIVTTAGTNNGAVGISFNSNTATPLVTPGVGSATNSATTANGVSPPLFGLNYAQQMEVSYGASVAFAGAQTSPARQENSLTIQLNH